MQARNRNVLEAIHEDIVRTSLEFARVSGSLREQELEKARLQGRLLGLYEIFSRFDPARGRVALTPDRES